MPEHIPLADLFIPERDRSALVAFQRGEPRNLADLERQVGGWYATFASTTGVRFVLHSADAFEFAAALLGAWHAGKCVLVPSDLQAASVARLGAQIDGFVGVEGGIAAAAPTVVDLPALDIHAPLLEMFTSGSTGLPVAIPKCVRQLDQEVRGLAGALDFGPLHRRVLGTVSHQHMYGLAFRVLLPLTTGRPFEAIRLPDVRDLSQVRAAEGCVLVSSPAQLVRLPEPGTVECNIRALLSAGGPLGEDGVQACQTVFGIPVTEIYGSSETGAVAWRMRTPGAASAWTPLPAVEFRSHDGLLDIRTPQLPSPEWFRSADLVVETATGFELAGRADRIVKLDEKRVSLDAVERVLQASGLLQKVHALVLYGARPVLAVAATPTPSGWLLMEQGKRRLVDSLREHLRLSAEVEVLPRSWRFIDPWPVTTEGKTPEALLRQRFDRRNPEFRVLEQGDAGCVAELWVSPTAPFFAGHFPEQPILPGVMQIDWLVWLSRELLGIKSGFAGLEAAKFRRVILPESLLRVTLRNDPAGNRTSYQIAHREQLCASGRIRWSADT